MGGGATRQFQWVTPNGHPVLYTTGAIGDQGDLRSCYDRMQFVAGGGANGLPAQFLQPGQVPSTGANIAYMAAPLGVNGVNFTAASSAGSELTYADLGVIGGAGGALGLPAKKMHYTTATLGRPPRHPDHLKRHEPTIYAQVSWSPWTRRLI